MKKFVGGALALLTLWAFIGEHGKVNDETPDRKQTPAEVTAPAKPLTAEERQALEKERLAKIETLQKQVKLVPTSDYAENFRLYRELRWLDPSNELFEKKYSYYQEKKIEMDAMERYPERFIKITEFSWTKAAFGNVMEVTLTLKNSLPYAVKDIQLKCVHEAPSGTVIDSNERTIYEAIKPGSARTVRNFNMGFIHNQAARSGCKVTGFAPG